MNYLPLDRKEDIKSHKYLRVMNQFTQQVNLLLYVRTVKRIDTTD